MVKLQGWRRCLPVAISAVLAASAVFAQPEGKTTCVVLMLHAQGATPQNVAGLAGKLKPACLVRAPDMPWSANRSALKDNADAMQEITRHVKELRQQGFKRVILAGHGQGANAAIAYAGQVGDVDGVVSLSASDEAAAAASLPAITGRMKQHVPLLWVVSSGDPLHAKGETYAFLKAPPHPLSRYVALKADTARNPEPAAKTMLEWVKSLE